VQNVEHNHNVQSHEILDLSLDYWRGSAVVNASDDASPVHTVMKDSKAIQVKRLFVVDLEGSCGDSGTNGWKAVLDLKRVISSISLRLVGRLAHVLRNCLMIGVRNL
jgi:hypothetical protein